MIRPRSVILIVSSFTYLSFPGLFTVLCFGTDPFFLACLQHIYIPPMFRPSSSKPLIMASNPDFLVEALRNVKLTPEQWTAISDACDQCLKTVGASPSPMISQPATVTVISARANVEQDMHSRSSSTTAVPSMPYVNSGRPVISDPATYNNLKRKLQEIQESASRESIVFPHLNRALHAYTNGRRDFVSSTRKAVAEGPHQPQIHS
ncbi:hypothetical protein IW262DRAFT_1373709 [Armillaria fumosa]|nr:hypothetical protein IW262DRAFT_1373709 [Armillaria fumosa]